jgi:6-phosphogluconolactonase
MGKSTCYVNIEQQSASYMVLVNYWDAKLSTVPLSPDGTAGTPTEVLMQPGAEYVAAQQPTREEHWTYRQRWPHSHCCVTEPYTQQLMFVTDLGLDKVFAYTLDAAAGCLSPQGEVQLKKGRGPRHLVFHPKHQVAYVGNELESTVTVLRYNAPVTAAAGSPYTVHDADDEGALLSHAQTLSTLPEEFRNEGFVTPLGVWKAASHSSEIRLHPNGRYLYVGNRGHDSICVLAIDEVDGSLSLVEIHPSGGRCPRNFNFDRTGRFLVVGNQDTNTLNTFSICAKSGRLSEVHTLELPSPNFVYAVPH